MPPGIPYTSSVMDPHVSFAGLLVVAALAFAAPLIASAVPGRPIPAVVLLIVGGIILGQSGLGLVTVDEPIRILALLGLAILLFLAGLEVEIGQLRGNRLRTALGGLALSGGLALVTSAGLGAAGLAEAPLLLAVILIGTSVGIVIPVLSDAGLAHASFGQTLIAAVSVAEVGSIVLLSVVFSRSARGPLEGFLLLVLLITLATALIFAVLRTERSMRLAPLLQRLQDTTAQIRVRGAWLLMVGFAALAEALGLEVILGAFLAGAILNVIDADGSMNHPAFRTKLEAVGHGVFVPVFFVATGLRFDVGALLASPTALLRVPIFIGALLIVRGLPAIAFRGSGSRREILGAGLIQATLLPIAPTQIGLELGLLDPATAAALITAGLVAAVVFPAVALRQFGRALPLSAALPGSTIRGDLPGAPT